jgi:hypothetical protein
MGVALFAAFVAVAGAQYDAKAHLLEAAGVAAADLRAPSASIARVKAERSARTQAEAKLKAALEELGAKKDVDKLIEAATVVDERFGTDGSVELRLRLSTEGLGLKKRHAQER